MIVDNGSYIIDYARSPIGRAFKGSMTNLRSDDLLSEVIKGLLGRNSHIDPNDLEDLLVGCGLPGGEQGFNIARVVGVLTGNINLPGATVNRYCGSSLQAIRNITHAIMAGFHNLAMVGGVESTSSFINGTSDNEENRNPRFNDAMARTEEYSSGAKTWSDTSVDQMPDVYAAMGETAENVAQYKNVSRKSMDEFALLSHQKATKALESGFFNKEILDVFGLEKRDDCIRTDTTYEALAALAPVFREDGRITAGNACPLNDGAGAMIIASGKYVKAHGLKPKARIISSGTIALNPEIMGLGPIKAVRLMVKNANMQVSDIDVFELNEAFAAQVLPCIDELKIDIDNVNVNGGAIALGHPFGMTGVRLAGTLSNVLEQKDKEIGCATLCVGGGQGMALMLQRV